MGYKYWCQSATVPVSTVRITLWSIKWCNTVIIEISRPRAFKWRITYPYQKTCTSKYLNEPLLPYCEHNNNVLLKMRDHRISDKAYGNRKGFINTVTNLLIHFYINIFAVSDIEYDKLKLCEYIYFNSSTFSISPNLWCR